MPSGQHRSLPCLRQGMVADLIWRDITVRGQERDGWRTSEIPALPRGRCARYAPLRDTMLAQSLARGGGCPPRCRGGEISAIQPHVATRRGTFGKGCEAMLLGVASSASPWCLHHQGLGERSQSRPREWARAAAISPGSWGGQRWKAEEEWWRCLLRGASAPRERGVRRAHAARRPEVDEPR
eukprot:gene17374-biopygen8935